MYPKTTSHDEVGAQVRVVGARSPDHTRSVVSDSPATLPPRYPVILATLAAVLFTGSSQFLIVAPVLPRIAEALAVPEERLGTLVTAYAVAVGCFAIAAGPISDHFGRRTVLRMGTAWMAAALLLHGLASSFEALLAVRFVAGTASGFLGGAAMAYIGDVVPDRARGQAMGIVSGGFAAGQILGIPIGTILAAQLDYRAPFLAFGLVMLACHVATWVVLVPSPGGTGRFSFTQALKGYREIVTRRDLLLVNAASVTMMLSVSAFITYEPLWIERTYGVDETGIALLFGAGGLANAVMGVLAGRWSDRVGRKRLAIGASAGLGLAMMSTPFMPSFMAILGLFIVTMGIVGMRIAPLNAWVTGLVPPSRRGSLMALFLATGQIGFAIGSALSGAVFGSVGFVGCAGIGMVGALLAAAFLAGVDEPARSAR